MMLYTLVVFVHVAAAAVLVGGSLLAAPGVRAAVRRARSPHEVRDFLAVARPLNVIDPVAALVVLATGVYLTSVGHWWNLGWVQVATALWVVNSVTAKAVVEPAVKRLAAAAADAAEGRIDAGLDALRWSRAWSLGPDLLAANDAAVLYLMTVKPGLTGSVVAVLVTNALVMAIGYTRRRSPAAAGPSGAPPLAPASGR
jgi:uncharacterized membrane protein